MVEQMLLMTTAQEHETQSQLQIPTAGELTAIVEEAKQVMKSLKESVPAKRKRPNSSNCRASQSGQYSAERKEYPNDQKVLPATSVSSNLASNADNPALNAIPLSVSISISDPYSYIMEVFDMIIAPTLNAHQLTPSHSAIRQALYRRLFSDVAKKELEPYNAPISNIDELSQIMLKSLNKAGIILI